MGIICRIFKNVECQRDGQPNPDYRPGLPAFWMEYLAGDDEKDGLTFSTDKAEAIVFPSHGLADARATELRAAHPEADFVFGAAISRHPSELEIKMDPFRAAQCRRDPADSVS